MFKERHELESSSISNLERGREDERLGKKKQSDKSGSRTMTRKVQERLASEAGFT